jgi:hypothetical protein
MSGTFTPYVMHILSLSLYLIVLMLLIISGPDTASQEKNKKNNTSDQEESRQGLLQAGISPASFFVSGQPGMHRRLSQADRIVV